MLTADVLHRAVPDRAVPALAALDWAVLGQPGSCRPGVDRVPPTWCRRLGHEQFGVLTRRGLLVGLGVTAVLSAAGCAGSATEGDGQEQAGTRVVEMDNGPVDVPLGPSRVVVTDNYLINSLYDLGLKPIAVPSDVLAAGVMPDEVVEWAGDAVEIGQAGQPEIEVVAELGPDLILDQFYPDTVEDLGAIAPVVFIDWRSAERTWQEQVALVAEAVNRKEELDNQIKAYEGRLVELQEAHADVIESTTWAIAAGGQGGDWILGATVMSVLDDLGATCLAGMTPGYESVSREELDRLADADVIIYPELFSGQPPAPTADLHQTDLWKSLPAVAAGNVYPSRYTGTSCYSWARGALDEIEAMLAQL